MKRFIYKVLAFIGDTIIVMLISFLLSNISFLNPNKDKINGIYDAEQVRYDEAIKIMDEMKSAIEDETVSSEEYEKINGLCNYYCEYLRNINEDEKTDDWYNDVMGNIIENHSSAVQEAEYQVSKNNKVLNICTLFVYILYFGVLEFALGGQTLFKKLFRLKTTNLDGSRVSLGKEIIKSILICELVFAAINIGLINLELNTYLKISNVISYVKYFYELAFIIVMLMRDDNRSIHDLLLKTRVDRYNKNGEVIEEHIFMEESKKDVEETPVKEVKTTKKPVRKSTKKSNKKEVVKAEKVND